MYETMHHLFDSGSIDDDDSPTEEAHRNGTLRREDDALMEEAQCQVTAKREELVSMEQAQCTGIATREDDVSMEEAQCTGTANRDDDASTEETRCNGSATSDESASDATTTTTFSSLAIGDLPLPTRVSKARPPADPLAQQKGKIEWVHGYFHTESPEWRCEIDTAIIKEIVEPQLEAHGFGTKGVSIEFFAAGGFNKLYTVTSTVGETGERRECIFRVTMPLDPWYKTESEVATMEYVRRHTSIPLPKVYAYDSSSDNRLGFEWIMMEKMAGKPLADYWDLYGYEFDRFDMPTKLHIARQVAEWVHQLSKLTFDKIGSLYIDWEVPEPTFKLGRLVHGGFFTGERLGYMVYRGPFRDTDQFYRSVIDIQLQDILNPIQRTRFEARQLRIQGMKKAEAENSEEKEKQCGGQLDWDHVEDDPEHDWYTEKDFVNVPKGCHALLRVLPLVLPRDPTAREPMTLFHFDISARNVLLDECGNLIGLVDWEFIGTKPYGQLPPIPDFMDNAGHDITKLDDWDSCEKDRTRMWHEREHAQTLMGREFRKYLEKRKSPWLRTFEPPPPVKTQLQERVHQIADIGRRMGDWVKRIEEGGEWNEWEV